MDLEFSGDVAAVGDDGIGGDAEVLGDFLVRHALHEADDHVFFAVAERVLAVGSGAEHVGNLGTHAVLLLLFDVLFDDRNEQFFFRFHVAGKPLLGVVDVEKGGGKLMIMLPIGGQIFGNDVLQFTQFASGLVMMFRENVDVIGRRLLALQEFLHVGEERFFFHTRVMLDGMRIFVEEFDDESREIIIGIERCEEALAYARELKTNVIGMRSP